MIKQEGMGRTRLGRFAAITIPAAALSAGLGVAVLQGAVAATLSSADGFQLKSDSMTTDAMKLRPGATEAGTTGNNVATAYAETGNSTTLNNMCMGVNQAMPSVAALVGLDRVGLKISSTGNVSTPNVALNAKSLSGGNGTTMSNVSAGEAQSETGFSTPGQSADTGYKGDGFGLTSGASTINQLDATSYAVSLASLSVSNLSIGVSKPADANVKMCS